MVDINGSTSTSAKHNGDDKINDDMDLESPPQANPPRPALRALIQDFSPIWFTWCMNTGILATLMHTLPYTFRGLNIIATVLYVLDMVFFIACSTLFSLRFMIYGKTAWEEISSDVNELCFTATLPISWMTLTTLTGLIVSNASWGAAFTLVSYAMWWVGAAWTLLFALATYILLATRSLTAPQTLSLAIILPAVATSTAAAEGGLICIYAHALSSRLAVPVIITSFMLLGIGVFIGLLIYGLFLIRLLTTDWFDGIKRPTLMLLLGPMGQSATALLALSTAAVMHFDTYNAPPPNTTPAVFYTPQSASALRAASTLLALLMLGFALFWLLFGLTGLFHALLGKQAKWTPAWYSTIFPVGTVNSCLTLLSTELDSPAFRVLSAGFLVLLVLGLLLNAAWTGRGVWRGDVLVVRVDPRKAKKR